MTDREVHPATRWDWEQIILRARFSGLIEGRKGKRGGVSGPAFKAVALVWAAHADPDGSRVWPGDAVLALEAEVGIQIAQAVKRKLVELGLTEKVRSGVRHRHGGDEYRLTIPSDLLEHLDVPTPAALRAMALTAYEKRRGVRRGSDGTPTDVTEDLLVGDPADPPRHDAGDTRGGSDGASTDTIDNLPLGDPTDPPLHDPRGGSDGTAAEGCGGSDGSPVGGPMARDTNPYQPPTTTNHADQDFFADVTTPRARASRTGRRPSPGGASIARPPQRDMTATPQSRPQRPAAPAPSPGTAPDSGPRRGAGGLGFCLACHTDGRIVVAADPVSGNTCPAHLRALAGGPPS